MYMRGDMAIYINSREWVSDLSRPGGRGEVVNYYVDAPADIPSLPGADRIKESSTALVIATSDVYVLGATGWRML